MTFGVSLTTPTWMAPVKWSEAGHDAVFVDASRGLVRFIQVTRAEHQNYDHIHFVEILDKLSLHDDLRGVRFRKSGRLPHKRRSSGIFVNISSSSDGKRTS
ncbi:hypothetical protein PInf_025876 [Phytophthora infestans]|nr:hypothetical protein PInf_025876 [Phytophthora infestans]